MAGTVELCVRSDYGQTGQYIARLTGRDSRYTFVREFLGRKTGNRKEYTELTTDQEGLFELCDKTRKGKECRYRVLITDPSDGMLVPVKISLEKAMQLATWLDEGYSLGDCLRVSTGEDGIVSASLVDPDQMDSWEYVRNETRKAFFSLSEENQRDLLEQHPELKGVVQ